MTRRSRAREVAMQLLVQRDFVPDVERAAIEAFVTERLRGQELRVFCLQLYDGVVENIALINESITKAARNWSLRRMPVVDRNVMRVGAYELLCHNETPAPVVVNEAIELVKRFGTADSASFVNGVLDQIRKSLPEQP
ncbi:MAG: transcription antitermination factor NusB [Gemmataceae bacterium]